MRYLKGEYARWFNTFSGREGALFERRFWSQTANADDYLYEICRYVALNPVRAGLCPTPEQWPWSSYAATLGLTPAPSFLTVARCARLVRGRRARSCSLRTVRG